MSGKGACAYLVSRYPGVTHAFIVAEVRALRATGVRVETASIRSVDAAEVLSPVDRQEHEATYAILPTTPWRVMRSHVRALARSPGAYAGTFARALRLAHAGGRARLWQLFYFAESILLWSWLEARGLRHVHVHHANVSADVAMLACSFANQAGNGRHWTWSLTIHGPTELLDIASHKLPDKVRDAAAVICTSDFARGQVLAFAGPDEIPRVHTVRCGIDLELFGRRAPRAAQAHETVEILCVAALSRRKGHRVLLDALARICRDHRNVRLTLVGDGPERAGLEQRADELGLSDHVTFTGAVGQNHIRDFYESADIFCLPSFAEGVPTVLMEAMAMELPVVATNVMGVAELVENDRTGFVVPAARSDELAAALVRLVIDPAARARMGTAGREHVARHCEISRAVDRLHAVLAPLIQD